MQPQQDNTDSNHERASASSGIRFSLKGVFLILTCVALLFGMVATVRWRQLELWRLEHENEVLREKLNQPSPLRVSVRNSPITIASSYVGDFGSSSGWHFSMNSAGKARASWYSIVAPADQDFQVTDAQMQELKEAIIREKFFELHDVYGDDNWHYPTTTISISAGSTTKTVILDDLRDSTGYEKAVSDEAQRALRIVKLIQDWFNPPVGINVTLPPRAP